MNKFVHFFSQNDVIKDAIDKNLLGMRGKQTNEFAELKFPILPGFIIDADIASKLEHESVTAAIEPFVKKIEKYVEKKFNDSKEPLLFKIVISPNLAISNYPALHNFGLTINTIDGFSEFVGEHFCSHEIVFMLRGYLKIEERIAEIEKRDKDHQKIKEAIHGLSSLMDDASIKVKPKAILENYAPLLPKGFFADSWKQMEIVLKRISHLLDIDEQDDCDTALIVQPIGRAHV